jgi:hypothetical protein
MRLAFLPVLPLLATAACHSAPASGGGATAPGDDEVDPYFEGCPAADGGAGNDNGPSGLPLVAPTELPAAPCDEGLKCSVYTQTPCPDPGRQGARALHACECNEGAWSCFEESTYPGSCADDAGED